jgi:hypothetical protein
MAILAAIRGSYREGNSQAASEITTQEGDHEVLIAVPTGDCRTAIKAAIKYSTDKRTEDHKAFEQTCYDRLYNGAVHNGLRPSLEQMNQMREMAARDAEHAITAHPATELLAELALFQKMVDYHNEPDIILDAHSFERIGGYLPARVTD